MTTYTLTGACSASWRPTRLAEGVKEPAASEAYDLSCDSCRCEHYQLFSTGWKEGVAQTEQVDTQMDLERDFGYWPCCRFHFPASPAQ
jgi:hypothetical protein